MAVLILKRKRINDSHASPVLGGGTFHAPYLTDTCSRDEEHSLLFLFLFLALGWMASASQSASWGAPPRLMDFALTTRTTTASVRDESPSTCTLGLEATCGLGQL